MYKTEVIKKEVILLIILVYGIFYGEYYNSGN